MSSPSERLSRRQRALTPEPFALWLGRLVHEAFDSRTPDILWVERSGVYPALYGAERCWDRERDARAYRGEGPVICHPPCGPWGVLAWKCKYQSRLDGIAAMEIVHRVGGVIEQPRGSQLFRQHGLGGLEIRINQGDFGFAAPKPTILYCFPPERFRRVIRFGEALASPVGGG